MYAILINYKVLVMSKLVEPKNILKEKAGDGGFNTEDIKKAQKAIEENDVDFKPIAQKLLQGVGTTIQDIRSKGAYNQACLGQVLDPLMQLRAQGALFKYPSITMISDVVVNFLDTENTIDNDVVEIIVAYQKAAEALLGLGVKDEADKVCKTLASELTQACVRYQKVKSK